MSQTTLNINNVTLTNSQENSYYDIIGSYMPMNFGCYIVVETIGKDGMLVRYILTKGPNADVSPKIRGLFPRAAFSNTTIVEHVLQNIDSKFISASSLFPEGATNFSGGPKVYIDINEAIKSGARIISSEEIIAALEKYKIDYPHLSSRIDRLVNAITTVEKEVLIQPGIPEKGPIRIPPKAIWTPEDYIKYTKLTKYARVVQIFGIALTAYHIEQAAEESLNTSSIKPLAAEGIRQAGGWGGAWLGFKAGGFIGGMIGIESGPGALLTGLVGGIICGFAAYWGADWVADYVSEN